MGLGAKLDGLTIASVAVVAYCLTNLVHEGLGHGAGCLLGGGKPDVLNAVFFRCDDDAMSAGGERILVAGGSVANLLFAGVAGVGLRWLRDRPGPLHYFCWLMLALNLLMPFGYLLFSGLGGFGDWAVFIDGLGPQLLLRGALAAVGGLLYFVVAPRLVMPGLNVYLGRDAGQRAARARMLSLLPYLVGGTTYVIAGLLNPESWTLVILSAAAASFGGTSLLAWFPGRADKAFRDAAPEEPASLDRHPGWIVLAVAVFAIFVGVFGPGVHVHLGKP
ncbi:MAG TPA: hypothetical protein VF765_00015 [Polyangiaceae bacterium]